MRKWETENLRNIALISHGGAGKTTLTEAILYSQGLTNRLGKVEAGNTVSDYEPEEIKRQISINLSLAPIIYKDKKINIIDTPGYDDFLGEVVAALSVVENSLILISSSSGVEVGTERVWQKAQEFNLPCIIFINGLDKENADFNKCVRSIKDILKIEPLILQLPLGEGLNFKGIVDIMKKKAYIDFQTDGGYKEIDIPEEIKDKVEEYEEKLNEMVAEVNDELLEKYLDGKPLSLEEKIKGLREGIVSGKIVPLLCGSAAKSVGIIPLLETIIVFGATPQDRGEIKGINPKTQQEEKRVINRSEPLSALVFKSFSDPYVGKITYFKVFSGNFFPDQQVYNSNKDKIERIGSLYIMRGKTQEPIDSLVAGDIGVVTKLAVTTTSDTLSDKDKPIILPEINFPQPIFSLAVEPKSRGDEEKMSTSFNKLMEEDLTFRMFRDDEIKQTIISGLGELHLEVMLDRLNRKFGVSVHTLSPKIPYKETISGKAQAQGKYKRQSGGRGQYGDVWLEVSPLPRGEGFQFIDKIVGGVIPKNYIPAVEKGVKEAMQEGILAGYPLIDLQVILYDGSYHPVDSSDMAFQIAASIGFKKAAEAAGLVLLEPIMNVEITVPQEYIGDIIGDINSKRGKVLGTESRGTNHLIKAQIPLMEMQRYAIDLRSKTQGRAGFSLEFSHYEEVPNFIAEKIIQQSKKS